MNLIQRQNISSNSKNGLDLVFTEYVPELTNGRVIQFFTFAVDDVTWIEVFVSALYEKRIVQ